MNGEAAQGGIDGQIYTSPRGAKLTVEPTNRFDNTVHLWAWVNGEEQHGVSLFPATLRTLARDLLARADLIDPAHRHGGDVEWCVFYGGPDPNNAAGTHRYLGDDGQADAEEDAQWLIESGVACRTVTYGAWEIQRATDLDTETAAEQDAADDVARDES